MELESVREILNQLYEVVNKYLKVSMIHRLAKKA